MEKQTSKYRWVVFSAVLFTYFLIVSQRTAPGLITDQLMKDFNITASTIGLLASIQFLAYAGLQIPIGILSDRYGPNFFLIIGTILNGVGTVIYSLAPHEFVLILARLLVGIGDAAIWVNLVLILSKWFRAQEFVRLLGFAAMSGSFGFLVATVPFASWISLSGWRAPFFITGMILCLSGIMLYFILEKKSNQLFKKAEGKGKAKNTHEKVLPLLRKVFSSRQAWAAFFCHFGLMGTYVGFIGSWAVPYGMNVYEMSRSAASQLVMFGLFGALAGAPLTSWISSRLGSIKRPYVLAHAIVFLSWSVFLLFDAKPPFFVLLVLFFIIGYGNGASSLTFAVVRQSFPVQEVGIVSGFANTGGFISAVLLPFFFGKVIDHFQLASSNIAYYYGLLIPVVFSVIGLAGGLLIQEKQKETKQAAHATA
ncbi:nitrate/nitrite transporter [Neobacillus niacini]|uniref:MFS transporter n=1 Tax=Neobacillus niacini TaxID=86668 RepID=UPI0021CAEC30|nr:MFS transporter [Neobacillus niacini]MCM3764426.1 MFS transporter [Neobacillus niacini]